MSSDILTCHCNRHPNRLCAFVNLMECEVPCQKALFHKDVVLQRFCQDNRGFILSLQRVLTGSALQTSSVLFPRCACCLRITTEFLSPFYYCVLDKYSCSYWLLHTGVMILLSYVFILSDISLQLQQHKIRYIVDRALISVILPKPSVLPSRHSRYLVSPLQYN